MLVKGATGISRNKLLDLFFIQYATYILGMKYEYII